MERDDILNRNKASKSKDEGVEYIKDKSRRYGEAGFCIFIVLLIVFNFIKGHPSNDLQAVFWGYIGVGQVYRYKVLKTKTSLVIAVCGIIAAICFSATYIYKMW